MADQRESILTSSEFRKLPSIDALLRQPEIMLIAGQFGTQSVTDSLRHLLLKARTAIITGESAPDIEVWPGLLSAHLEATSQATLRPVINATGVIIHTNLGRAPLSQAAIEAVSAVSQGYSNLEYNLTLGERGSRYDHTQRLICELTGAEDAIVLNNCAAAIYLILAALCQERQVLISRGQLVEIGGGFRIPDVLRQSGVHLVEVGTTNRTHLRDFSEAITAQTAAIMRVHSSNFRQIGFVTMPNLEELAGVAHQNSPPLLVIDDLGSGALIDTAQYGLAPEPTVRESIRAGADLVAFSGDKLLGGPQAGIVAGRKELVAQLRRHPMARALRVDKMTLAALEATLRSYQRQHVCAEIPVWQMISASQQALQKRVEAWRAHLAVLGIDAEMWAGESAIGGGSLPGETLPTCLLAIPSISPDEVATQLRQASTAIVCRIQHEHLLFDARTVFPAQEATFLTILGAILKTRIPNTSTYSGRSA